MEENPKDIQTLLIILFTSTVIAIGGITFVLDYIDRHFLTLDTTT
jgi:hypothetical protein